MNPNLTNLGPIVRTILTAVNWPGNELRYQLSDLAPTVRPWSVPEMPGATTVNGTLNAATQIGDPISVKVITAPTQGTVTVTDDGRFFTYTPDEAVAGTPGTDTFTAEVTDEGFHLQSLFGIAGHSTTVEVPVVWQDLAPSPLGGDNLYGYYIWNYTGYTLTVTGKETQAIVQAPEVGTVIPQGEYTFVQMQSGSEKDKKSIFYLDKTGPGLAEIAPTDVSGYDYTAITKLNYNYDGSYFYDKKTECSANPSAGTCDGTNNDGSNIYLYDLPNTIFYVQGDTAAGVDVQNSIANKYVADDGSNVEFLNPSNNIGYTPLTPIAGYPQVICSPNLSCSHSVSEAYSVARTSGHTDTIGVSLQLGTGKDSAINLQATASYQRSWSKSVTDTTTRTDTQTVSIPASGAPASPTGYTEFAFMASPVIYSSGQTTVTAYNDQYYLLDTWYTWPDYSGNNSLTQNPYIEHLVCPSGGAACASMAKGIVPPGYKNFVQDPVTNALSGGGECTDDCDYYYGVYGGTDPYTGLTLLNTVSYLPTYYLSQPTA